jgi:phage shock protein PspC (stress-responsive transcriptional regulator)
MNWYCTNRPSRILARGCAGVVAGVLLLWLLGATSMTWLVVLAVPLGLTGLSITQYIVQRRSGSRI